VEQIAGLPEQYRVKPPELPDRMQLIEEAELSSMRPAQPSATVATARFMRRRFIQLPPAEAFKNAAA
jgi:hypothetical protein